MRRSARRPPWLLPAALCLVVGVIQAFALLPTLQIQLSGVQDEGNVLIESVRMVGGAVPYRDFFLRFMPGTPAAIAAWFSIFGSSMLAARIYYLVMLVSLTMLIQLASWLVFRNLKSERPSSSAAARTAAWSVLPTLLFICIGAQAWPLESWHWDADVYAMGAVIVIAGQGAPRSRRRLVLGGMLAGLSVLFLQTKGTAAAVSLLLLVASDRGAWRDRLRQVGGYALGLAIPVGLFTAFLMWNGCLSTFFHDTVTFNLTNYLNLHAEPLKLSMIGHDTLVALGYLAYIGAMPFRLWLAGFLEATSFCAVEWVQFGSFLPVLVLGLILAALRRRQDAEGAVAASMMFAFCVLTGVAAALDGARMNRYHINFQTPFWYVILIWVLHEAVYVVPRVSSRPRRAASLIALCGTLLIAVMFSINGFFNLADWGRYRYPVAYAVGTLYSSSPEEATARHQILAVVDRLLKGRPNATLFAFPYAPFDMFLLGRPNPVRFPEAVPVEYGAPLLVQMKSDLERAQVPLLLYIPLNPEVVAADFPRTTAEQFSHAQDVLRDTLTAGYAPVFVGPSYMMYGRQGAVNPLR